MSGEVVLWGIDGANPLGFLAAIGTLSLLAHKNHQPKLAWRMSEGRWRPVISETFIHQESSDEKETALTHELYSLLGETSSEPFEIDSKLPFPAILFAKQLQVLLTHVNATDRRTADILAAYGSEIITGDKGAFQGTAFCMVRSGDSAGNGLPAYALELRRLCGERELLRTLFKDWDYLDQGPSLRWDPLEDRRYALTWADPKKDSSNKPVMLGANVLALEALAFFPSVPKAAHLRTTGFSAVSRNRTVFTWPIWESLLGYEELRSVLGHAELHKLVPNRNLLARRGIAEVFRSERIAPNQYYKNFTPAHPA